MIESTLQGSCVGSLYCIYFGEEDLLLAGLLAWFVSWSGGNAFSNDSIHDGFVLLRVDFG